MNYIQTKISFWLQKDPSQVIKTYRYCIYGLLLSDLVLNIPILQYTLAPNSLTPIYGSPNSGILATVLDILSLPPFSSFYLFFVAFYVILLMMGLFRVYENIVALLLFFSFKILMVKTPELNNGGHDLVALVLFHNIFFNASAKPWLRAISNIALFFARLQVCSMYFFAGINKLYGHTWLDGTALELVLRNEVYSNWYIQDVFLATPGLLTIGTYLILAYQLLFSVLVWIKPLKKQVLLFGLLFHLSIWWICGLYDFAWFAMASYALFLSAKPAN